MERISYCNYGSVWVEVINDKAETKLEKVLRGTFWDGPVHALS